MSSQNDRWGDTPEKPKEQTVMEFLSEWSKVIRIGIAAILFLITIFPCYYMIVMAVFAHMTFAPEVIFATCVLVVVLGIPSGSIVFEFLRV